MCNLKFKFIHSFIVSVRNHPKMDLAEPQAVCLQARFLPEGVAQNTNEPQGNDQVTSSPQCTKVPSSKMLSYVLINLMIKGSCETNSHPTFEHLKHALIGTKFIPTLSDEI